MKESQNQNLGEKFKETIADAMKTGDFRNLNVLVTETVNDALREADFQENLKKAQTKQKVWESQKNWQERQQQDARARSEARQAKRQNPNASAQSAATQTGTQNQNTVPHSPTAAQMQTMVKMERKGQVSGTLFTVFGGIGLGFSGLGLFVELLLASLQVTALSAAILPGILCVGFLDMILYGNGQRKRLKRADKYLELCGSKMYGVIDEIARYTGKSVRYIRRDIRKMLHSGMFPTGHLDDKETCFMLNDVIYHQYLETEKAYLAKKEEEKQIPQTKEPEEISEEDAREQELHSMVAEGMEYIRHLRELNERIEGEVISEKLYRLEDLLKEIFDRVQEHPEQMHRMHKMMDYYLPTMLKLVEQYAEFDEVSAPGEDILEAKTEIEKTLDMINQAFVTLLNNLFQDAVFDASADAQVLQTMLAKEGLTESDFTMDSGR